MTINGTVPEPGTASKPQQRASRATRKSMNPGVFWRLSEPIPTRLDWVLRLASVVVPLILWWVLSESELVNPKFLPSPLDVIGAFGRLWEKGLFLDDLQASLFRVGTGFLLAAVLSVPFGIAMGAFASVRSLLEPIVGIIRYMPAPAFIPLLIIYLGLDEAPKIALIFIGVNFLKTQMFMDAVKFVPKHLLETTYTLGGSQLQTLTQVITPYVVPNIIDAFRINMAAAWNLVVVAELIAANEGLGKRIAIAQKFFRTDEIFAYLIVLGVIGFLVDLTLRILLKTTCKWATD